MDTAAQTQGARFWGTIVLIGVGLAASAASAATITVNSNADTVADDGVCTLREAITAANTNTASGTMAGECVAGAAGLDTIVFNIPGAGVHTITPATVMPDIVEPLVIDGYTQPGASANTLAVGDNAVLNIELDGTSLLFAGPLRLVSGGSTIRGLVINRVAGPSILIGPSIFPSDNNVITGNFIGTNPAGTTLLDGGANIHIQVNGSGNTIGGSAAGERNVMAGSGIALQLIAGNGNVIQGNYIGVNAAGTAALPASNGAIQVSGINTNNVIGGPAAGAGNVLVALFTTIELQTNTANTLIQGNILGTNATGTAGLGAGNGIFDGSAGATTILNNLVSGGTDPGAAGIAVEIEVVGGPSGAKVVQGNKIGTDITGTLPIPNKLHGVFIVQTHPTSAVVQSNTIAFNGGTGVNFTGGGASSTGFGILGNSIFSNTLLGISLSNAVVPTPNDLGDADAGSNNLQNFPVLSSATVAAGNATVSGNLNSTASTTFRVEFFSNAVCDASGNGEGQTFIGFANVATDGSGNASFGPLVFPVPAGQSVITSTATDPANNTSEFSACLVAPPPLPTLSINNVSANEGNSGTTPFVFTVTLSAVSASTVTVNYATADGTATAPSDYAATSGTLTFNPGVTTQPITVNVVGDLTVEPNETFTVNLSAPTNATIATGTGTGTIVNDDAPPLPTLSINNVSANEGNSGTTAFTFTVTLSAASASTVTVNYATADGTATAPGDYAATSGTLTFNPGITTQPITVNVVGDTTVEATETFSVILSAPTNATIAAGTGTGTIVNDDGAVVGSTPIPTLSDWALLALAMLLLASATTQLRKRRR